MNRLNTILLSSTFAGAMLGAGIRPAYTNLMCDLRAYQAEALESNQDISNYKAFQMAAQRRSNDNLNALWKGLGTGAMLGLTFGAAGAVVFRKRKAAPELVAE